MIVFGNTLEGFLMFRTKQKNHFNMFRYKKNLHNSKIRPLFQMTSIKAHLIIAVNIACIAVDGKFPLDCSNYNAISNNIYNGPSPSPTYSSNIKDRFK